MVEAGIFFTPYQVRITRQAGILDFPDCGFV